MTTKRRIERLETMGPNNKVHHGIKFIIDGLAAQNYRLEVGSRTVETLTRETGESQDAFEVRTDTLLDVQTYELRNSPLMPMLWADMPPIPPSDNCISSSTGKPIRITIGGQT
jgi:hypothetical protein